MERNCSEVKTYFVTIPAHKFLHIRNYESIGYWDFWQKQSAIPGRDCDTICGLPESIPNKPDDLGGSGNDSGAGQVMAFIHAPEGRICSWGIPLAEAYGVRLPADYQGPVRRVELTHGGRYPLAPSSRERRPLPGNPAKRSAPGPLAGPGRKIIGSAGNLSQWRRAHGKPGKLPRIRSPAAARRTGNR